MYQQSKAQEAQYKFMSDQAEANAALAEEQAEDAYIRGEIDETEFRQNVANVKSQQRLGFAAGGFDVTEGSALDVLENTAELSEIDALRIRSSAHDEARAYLMGAHNLNMQASQYEASAAQTAYLRPIQIGATLLSGGSRIIGAGAGGGASGSEYRIQTPAYQTGIETGSFGR